MAAPYDIGLRRAVAVAYLRITGTLRVRIGHNAHRAVRGGASDSDAGVVVCARHLHWQTARDVRRGHSCHVFRGRVPNRGPVPPSMPVATWRSDNTCPHWPLARALGSAIVQVAEGTAAPGAGEFESEASLSCP